MPVIGCLSSASAAQPLRREGAFRQGLGEAGYVERQSVTIEFRWAENQAYQLPRLVADLVRRQVAVIATTGGTASALADQRATSTNPIGFEVGRDPLARRADVELSPARRHVTRIRLEAPAGGPNLID